MRRCRLRQDRSRHARGISRRRGRQAGRRAGADDDSRATALADLSPSLSQSPGAHRNGEPIPHVARKSRRFLQETAKGKVDIVIGTHRLLQKDVEFKDLGLVIIDEEHRFGVVHKERLKKLRQLVDVLSLTATPIPRTLHMSLVGIRDLSIIETPPVDRLAIQTYVTRYDERLIRDAILRELERGGQVFFLA